MYCYLIGLYTQEVSVINSPSCTNEICECKIFYNILKDIKKLDASIMYCKIYYTHILPFVKDG
jgi:hypothetical protein